MSVCLVEVPCNWRSVRNIQNTNALLTQRNFLEGKVELCEKRSSLHLPLERIMEIDIIEMRDWVSEFVREKVSLYHRIEFEELPNRIERIYIGLTFRFVSIDDAFFFKLRWY